MLKLKYFKLILIVINQSIIKIKYKFINKKIWKINMDQKLIYKKIRPIFKFFCLFIFML